MSDNRLEHYKTIDPSDAKQLQEKLRKRIDLSDLKSKPRLIGGADISFDRGSDVMHAAIVVLELPKLQPVARSLVSEKTDFPYIPGLLAFREIPILLSAWQQISVKPDVLILDGHGIAHPRRMGIATHFGIEIDHPTIGCAKNILSGTHKKLGISKGDFAKLMDGEEQVGLAVRSRKKVKPIFVSPGHRLSFSDARKLVMKSLTKYKLPETTRVAHQWANRLRKGEVEEGFLSRP